MNSGASLTVHVQLLIKVPSHELPQAANRVVGRLSAVYPL
jgi:hypothetical protein